MNLYDVIVVGGGPTGSYAARKLAEKGHRVMVLERKGVAGDPVCCTGIIGQECASDFAIDDRLILKRVNHASLFSPSGNRLILRREKPQACILDRAAFDVAMAELAQKAGADYAFQSTVKDIVIDKTKASVAVSCRGKGITLQAKSVVIASGFGPGICRRLGLGRPGDFTIGAQAEVNTAEMDEVEVYFGRGIAPGFFAWLVPTTPGTARAGLMARKNPGLYLKEWLTRLAARGKIISPEVKVSCRGIPLKPLPRTYGERLLVVGDAAGQVKPTSGGGIYYGLLGADIAADTLHKALADGDLSAKRLAQYQRQWRRRLGRELRIGYWARKLFERLSDRQIDRIFEIVKADGMDKTLLEAEELSFDWHSKVIMRLIGNRILPGAIDLIKIPFRIS